MFDGKATDLQIDMRTLLPMPDSLYGIYANATGKTLQDIATDCGQIKWLTATEMLEHRRTDTGARAAAGDARVESSVVLLRPLL